MTVGLYMDVHVHRSVTRGLRRRGVDVITAQEDGTTTFRDVDLLNRSTALRRPIVSYDEDFLVEAQRRQAEGIFFAGLRHAPERTVVIGRMISDLALIASVLEPAETFNQVFFLAILVSLPGRRPGRERRFAAEGSGAAIMEP